LWKKDPNPPKNQIEPATEIKATKEAWTETEEVAQEDLFPDGSKTLSFDNFKNEDLALF